MQQEVTVPEDTDEPPEVAEYPGETEASEAPILDEDGAYTTKEDVALYIHLYGHLPRTSSRRRNPKSWGGPAVLWSLMHRVCASEQPVWKLRRPADGGGGVDLYGMRHRYIGGGKAGRKAHCFFQRWAGLLYGGSLRDL